MRWRLLCCFLVSSAAWLASELFDFEQFEGSKHYRFLLGLWRCVGSTNIWCSLSSSLLLHLVNGLRVNQTWRRWQDIWWTSCACLMSSLCLSWGKPSCRRSRAITHWLSNLLARVLDHCLRWIVLRQPWNTRTVLFSAEAAFLVVCAGEVAGCRNLIILTVATWSNRGGDHGLFGKSAQRTWTNVVLSC